MNFENPAASEENRMDSNEAHEEANLIRAKAGVSPETAKMPDPEDGFMRKATPEDYDEALKVVEEMKQLAEDEPAAEKMMMLIGRVAERTRDGAMVLLRTFAMPWGGDSKAEKTHDAIMARLTDASKEISDLKHKADKFEK